MTTQPDPIKEFFEFFADDIRNSEALSSTDLAASSIAMHSGEHRNRKLNRSTGSLRFTGHGIHDHRGSADGLFSAGSAFVQLVTTVGSALSGARTKVSENAARLTKLNLDASPEPGSVIFNLVPAIYPEEELRPNGEALDKGEQLVDRSIQAIEHLMALHLVNAGDEIADDLERLGPMVSRALKSFVIAAEDQYLDVDFAWREPLKASRKWKLNTGDAAFIRRIIEGRKLDDEPTLLAGTWKTVSTSENWVLVDDEFGTIAVNMADIPGAPWSDHNPDECVQMHATMTVREAPGKQPQRTFRATKILPTDYIAK